MKMANIYTAAFLVACVACLVEGRAFPEAIPDANPEAGPGFFDFITEPIKAVISAQADVAGHAVEEYVGIGSRLG